MVTLTAAADGSHLQGAMIALMPTAEDAARLAIEGGEDADQLHLTLYFLGDDGAAWTEDQRNELIGNVRAVAASQFAGPITARVFGANHWNAGSDSPSWVWAVGDDREADGPGLEDVHREVTYALEDTHNHPDLPVQHSPWVPHICAIYSDEPDLILALEERLGPVTFDRIRLAFAGDHTDVPLEGGMTAAAGPLRRQPTELELASRVDFAEMNDAWHKAVDDTLDAWTDIQTGQREQITAAVQAAVEADDLDKLDTLTVDTGDAAALLFTRMRAYAEQAGRAQQREAEAQGVTVPEWSLDDEAVTAAAFRDRLRQVARTTARLLGAGLVQSGVRQAMRLFGSGSAGQIAAQVDQYLAALSDASVRDALGGAMSAAQNEGRMAVLAVAPPGTYVASEALDKSSCKPCRDIDGTRYSSLTEARQAYPTGGYAECLGGSRCRGFVVAVWNEDEQAAQAGTILAASAATIPTTEHEQGGTVYRTVQDHPDCGADTPWAVVDEEDQLQGCFASQAEADGQAATLNDAEEHPTGEPDEGSMDYAGETAPWEGPLRWYKRTMLPVQTLHR